MVETSASLLERLRSAGDQQAWQRFVELYTPLLLSWARRIGVSSQDAADLIQDVLILLVKRLPEFQYDASGSFRSWLHVVLRNKYHDWRKKHLTIHRAELAAAVPDEYREADDGFSETEYRQYLIAAALRYVEREFSHSIGRAFREYAIAGRSATAVAADLGISENAVYLAKSRVMRRLKQELAGLLE
jgi:RNA polymerase sigma-70 factor (ECF subfamily)